MEKRLLSIYLNDHLAGSRGAIGVAYRSARSNHGTPLGDDLGRLAREIEEDRATLEDLMEKAGVARAAVKDGVAWVAERLGRFKLNGRLLSYSPLSRLEELEMLRLGIEGKRSLWRNLAEIGVEVDGWRGVDFESLIRRAEAQIEVLESHRTSAVRQAFLESATV